MIRFLLKGLWRDKSRSRLPIIVVATGVMLTVFMHAYITGFMGDTIEMNARFSYGHIKVMTRAYAELSDQIPNDLALLNSDETMLLLRTSYPEMEWTERIQFGGLIDVPDANGETKSQGPAIGFAIHLLNTQKGDVDRMKISNAIKLGTLPQHPNEALLSDDFASKLGLKIGDVFTLMGSSMNGSMTMYNFTLAGTVIFGVEMMDRGSVITDIEDVRQALEMQNASGELLGFFKEGFYNDDRATEIASEFNATFKNVDDPYAPIMKSLGQQGSMGQYVEMAKVWSFYVSLIFIIAMSLVLWNAGLLGGLRRYGEVGLRIAIGEEKIHVYKTMIYESLLIGIAGTITGTVLGLFFAYLLQRYGLDISGAMEGSTLMFPTVIKARITLTDYYIGFFPGIVSTVLGTALSGIGIFKRQTASLFKELES